MVGRMLSADDLPIGMLLGFPVAIEQDGVTAAVSWLAAA
jgi:hypothetical protein